MSVEVDVACNWVEFLTASMSDSQL